MATKIALISHGQIRSADRTRDVTIRWRRMSQLDFFVGTFAPFLRASDRPMAMACFRLLTLPPLPPLPERSVPRFLRRMALATVLPAALPYLRPPDFLREPFLAAICFLPPLRGLTLRAGCPDAPQ